MGEGDLMMGVPVASSQGPGRSGLHLPGAAGPSRSRVGDCLMAVAVALVDDDDEVDG